MRLAVRTERFAPRSRRLAAAMIIALLLRAQAIGQPTAATSTTAIFTASAPAAKDARATSAPVDIENSIGMKFRLIPPGAFSMGLPDAVRTEEPPAEYPPHRVRITRAFYLGVHEVTQQQYGAVVGRNPSWRSAVGGGADAAPADTRSLPVEQVSWFGAVDFCRKLGALDGERAAGRAYRLPAEAEWEYACRGGKTAPFAEPAPKQAQQEIRPVGEGPANELGIYDMRGNVWEWCADWHGVGYYAASPRDDPPGPRSGVLRVVRGRDWIFGGFGDHPYLVRDPSPPSRKSRWLGFRVVCQVEPAKK